MNAVTRPVAAGLPAAFANMKPEAVFDEYTSGVVAGFPVISFRGKVWRIRKAGKEENNTDAEGDAVQSLQVVLLRSNPHVSKVFYRGKFEEGSNSPPDCWSSDGITPDKEVQKPVAKQCAACPNNIWGSRMTESGTKARACGDFRRMAVLFADDLAENGKAATPFLMRVPPASLNPVKDYAENLKARGVYPFAIITKMGFDPQVAHPKLTLKPVRVLTDDEAEGVVALRDSEIVKRILASSDELAAAGTTGEEAPERPAEPAPAAASPPAASRKRQPVEDEDIDNIPGLAVPSVTVAAEEDDPPPPPVVVQQPGAVPPRKKRAAAAPSAPVGVPVQSKPAATAGDSFDDMLNNILGTAPGG